jgi:hypothetical protein
VEFDESVDGFCAAVGGAGGVEVGQERRPPAFEGLAEPGDLGDRARREGLDDLEGEPPSGGRVALVIDLPQLLGALPG